MKKVKESGGSMTLVIGKQLSYLLIPALISSCSVSKQISKHANAILLKDSAIRTGHIGISIYEPATGKYLYNYNADKYFIPASNTKLFTLYAGMKFLGDSLVGLRYQNISDTAINILATGDPTFLHPDFKNQPSLDFLKAQNRTIYSSGNFKTKVLGYGWAWDDYNDNYMVERNAFPIYGNIIKIRILGFKEVENRYSTPNWNIVPKYFEGFIPVDFSVSGKTAAYLWKDSIRLRSLAQSFTVERDRVTNHLNLYKELRF